MNAEFDWWLLLLGAVAGAALAWLVLTDSARREQDVAEEEVAAEAGWIARTLAESGEPVDAETAERVLRAHRRYLRLPPPDALVDPAELEAPADRGVSINVAAEQPPVGRGSVDAAPVDAPAGERDPA